MWHCRQNSRITGTCLALAICIGIVPMDSHATRPSSLSRWLSREVVPEIQELLAQHPRYAGQRVRIVSGSANALTEALASVLSINLAQHDGVRLAATNSAAPQRGVSVASIDELDCQPGPDADYLLQVSANRTESRQGRVQLTLLDSKDTDQQVRTWQWLGAFSSGERAYLKKPAGPVDANGSLTAPWSERDVDAAAFALSREFACAVRPQVATRLSLQWPGQTKLPALFADTANASRHQLGAYREIGITREPAAYSVDFRLERFRHDTWQLWLIGTPRQSAFAPVQAVTYFKASDLAWPAPAIATAASPALAAPADLGPALDYIEVEMLDATQADLGRSRAELQVTLRIANRAAWPIEYSFTLSGGHFDHCIASPGYYRHDRYGRVTGSVEAGASVVRRLIIEDTQHQPTPWFGVRKCAGFRDLDGFEEFASQGYKVIDFVRWDS